MGKRGRIKIYVIQVGGIYKLRIVDTRTKRVLRTESTGLRRRRDAERIADEREVELNSRPEDDRSLTWDRACMRYDYEVLRLKSPGYRAQFGSASVMIEQLTAIKHTTEIDQSWVSKAMVRLVDTMKSPSSASSYGKVLRAFFRWLADEGVIPPVKIRVVSVDDSEAARGEPLTKPQYEAILDATPLVVEGCRAESVQQFIEGLWLSGFRLDELFRLTWDDTQQIHIRDVTADPPIVVFPPRKSKGKRAEIWVIPPDYQEHLLRWNARHGVIYSPLTTHLKRYGTSSSLGKLIGKISQRAGVSVTAGDGRQRWATANDLRRSFVQRWYEITGDLYIAQRMARHKSDVVTKRFYTREQADRLHARIVKAYSKLPRSE